MRRNDQIDIEDLTVRDDVLTAMRTHADDVQLWKHNKQLYLLVPVRGALGAVIQLGAGLARMIGKRFFNRLGPEPGEQGEAPISAYRQGRADKHFKADVTQVRAPPDGTLYNLTKSDVTKLQRIAGKLDLAEPSQAATFRERVENQAAAFKNDTRKRFGKVAARKHAEAYLKMVGGAV
jgi:hypothetical protein